MEPSDPSYLQASRCTCLVELDGSAKNYQLHSAMENLMLFSALQKWTWKSWTCLQSHVLVIHGRINFALNPDLKPGRVQLV